MQRLIKEGRVTLAWSYVLDYENAANPCPERRAEIQRWKDLTTCFARETQQILSAMRDGISKGLSPLDALHIACAMEMDCEIFLTVDKGILNKVQNFSEIRIMNPVDFVLEWEGEDVG